MEYHRILGELSGKALVMGNEVIVRGVIEVGVKVASRYSSTLSSKVFMTLTPILRKYVFQMGCERES